MVFKDAELLVNPLFNLRTGIISILYNYICGRRYRDTVHANLYAPTWFYLLVNECSQVVVLTNNDHHHQLFILEVFVTPGKTNRGQVQRAPRAAVSHLHLILFH